MAKVYNNFYFFFYLPSKSMFFYLSLENQNNLRNQSEHQKW